MSWEDRISEAELLVKIIDEVGRTELLKTRKNMLETGKKSTLISPTNIRLFGGNVTIITVFEPNKE